MAGLLFIFHQLFPSWQMCSCILETVPLTQIFIQNPAIKNIVIHLDKRPLKLPLHVLCDSFEDCFPLSLGDLSESNIIHDAVFHYPALPPPIHPNQKKPRICSETR